MGAMKRYLLDLITACAPDNGFAQDAIEHHLMHNHFHTTGHLPTDVARIMDQYDRILTTYRAERELACLAA